MTEHVIPMRRGMGLVLNLKRDSYYYLCTTPQGAWLWWLSSAQTKITTEAELPICLADLVFASSLHFSNVMLNYF